MTQPRPSVLQLSLILLAAGLAHCSSSAASTDTDAGCYPDNDGINNVVAIIDLTVDDTGFSKTVISTQNDSPVTLTLTNKGTKMHGFEVGCTTTTAPAGCATRVCFPDDSTIAPLAPGASKTITFETPTPDGLVYPFKSSAPADNEVKAFSGGWNLM